MPASNSAEDLAANARADAYMNRQYLDPVFFGRYPKELPEMYGEVGSGVRAAGVRRFGYLVYYRVVPSGVEVIAIGIDLTRTRSATAGGSEREFQWRCFHNLVRGIEVASGWLHRFVRRFVHCALGL